MAEKSGLAWLAQNVSSGKPPLDEMDVAIIRALAENGMSVTRAADATFYARRTVYYRMEAIAKKTGLNPNDFYDLCSLVKIIGGDTKTKKRFCTVCGIAYNGDSRRSYCPECRIKIASRMKGEAHGKT